MSRRVGAGIAPAARASVTDGQSQVGRWRSVLTYPAVPFYLRTADAVSKEVTMEAWANGSGADNVDSRPGFGVTLDVNPAQPLTNGGEMTNGREPAVASRSRQVHTLATA